jgi:filamentous hemagglutinin family protein
MDYHHKPGTYLRKTIFLVFLWLFGQNAVAHAQITINWGQGSVTPLSGPNFVISSDLGHIRGSNLFHSFGLFNILQGESATFTGPNSINNIIGRVTGGQQSVINGLLRSDISGANVFLINPAGILFGPYVQLDVKGSFHVSTADYLRFADGAKFHADLAKQSTLTTADVSAFGFLSKTPAGITIDQSQDDPSVPLAKRIEVLPGKTISLIGGDIDMTGAPFRTGFIGQPTIEAPSGEINLVSIGSPGEVVLNATGLTNGIGLSGFTELGNITLNKDVLIQTSSVQGNGTIAIRGNNLVMNNNSFIFSDTSGSVSGAPVGIDIDLTGRLQLTGGARVTSEIDFLAAGSAGDVIIKANDIEVSGIGQDGFASLIGSRLFPGSTGAGADIDITTKNLTVSDGASISTATAGTGVPGEIRIKAASVRINGGFISSTTFGAGLGGAIRITDAQNVVLDSGASIAAISTSTGNAGDIIIKASNALQLSGSSITTQAETANGGNIDLSISKLVNLFNSQITTAVSNGAGGGGDISLDSSLIALNNSQISANAFGGPGGNVTISGDAFLASTTSSVTASSTLSTPGTVDIQAPITDLSGSLAPLPETVLQVTSLLRQSCAARYSSGQLSSLVVGSRDGLPFEPGGFMPSLPYQTEQNLNPTHALGIMAPAKSQFAAALSIAGKLSPITTWPCTR